MKSKILILGLCITTFTASAQYPQKLPIDFNSFFSAKASGAGAVLEKGEYRLSNQDGSNPLMANQWNRGGKNTEWNGVSAVTEQSKLSYSTYIDNNAGKAIVLNPEIEGIRSTIYSLTTKSEYTNETFYLGALINISEAPKSGDQFLALDGNYSGKQQRARVCVKSSETKGAFNIGLGWETTASSWSGDLQYGTTYLVVIKVTPSSKGAESASLYVNPQIGGKEKNETEIGSVSSTEADMKKIRGILIRQRSHLGGEIASLRFSNSWGDIVK